MKNITGKIKITLIAVLVLLLVGFVLFGVLGFNDTADFSDGYELNVGVEVNIGDASKILKETTDAYLSEKNVSYKGYALEKLDEGGTYVFKFKKDVSENISLDDLKTKIETAMQSSDILSGLEVSVNYFARKNLGNKNLWLLLSVGIALVAVFVYTLIMDKLSGATSLITVSVGSALLFFALMGITRIPLAEFFFPCMAVSAMLSAVFACGIIARCNEAFKNVGNDKKSYDSIADECTYSSLFRIAFISIALAVFGIAFIAIGPAYLRILGLQLIVADLCAVFTSYSFTGILWGKCKGLKKSRKTETKTQNN